MIFVWAVRALWRELAPVIGVSLVWLLWWVPIVAAVMSGESWLTALTLLPGLIGTTGLFGSLAEVSRGGAVRLPWRGRIDALLAAGAWLWLLGAAWVAGSGPAGVVVASALGAVGVLVLPLAFAYATVRDRHGLTAIRAGAVIAILRPGLAITIAASLCLAAFACIATAGTLLVMAPALVALMACRAIRTLVDPDGDQVAGTD
jgi:hypothetical protein